MRKSKQNTITARVFILCLIITFVMASILTGCGGDQPKELSELPKPEITGGARGELGIDKNINESNIDDYLGREDAVYRDMRMLEDPAQYENIGGDRFLSGYIEGFEVVPLPYIMPVNGLPSAVGETYSGDTLFGYNDEYEFVPLYEESMAIMEELFPKDKVIFLMCGGGGYAGMTKNFLISLGWDPDKIYNVGGYWFYNGEHNIEVKKEENGVATYDFDSVPYHDIDFSTLTKGNYKLDPEKKLTNIVISTDMIELEEDTTYQLNAVAVPFDAANSELAWTSSDESIAYVDWSGLVRGVNPGTVTVTVAPSDGSDLSATCEVTITERASTEPVALDDLAEEAKAFADNDPNSIMNEFYAIGNDMDKAVEDGYYVFEGDGYTVTDLWREELSKSEAKAEECINARTEILNKLIEEQRTFILLIYTKDCEGRTYHATEGAEKILKEKGIPYFYTNDIVSEYDRSLYESKIDYEKAVMSSVVIFKEGQIYAGLDPDVDSIKSDEDLKNWLGKYIDLE